MLLTLGWNCAGVGVPADVIIHCIPAVIVVPIVSGR
jgi:hypothetical protein